MKYTRLHSKKHVVLFVILIWLIMPIAKIMLKIPISWTNLIILCAFLTPIFAGFSAIFTAYFTDISYNEDDHSISGIGLFGENVSLESATRSWWLSLGGAIAFVDKKHRAITWLPRPFWAEDPQLIREILSTFESLKADQYNSNELEDK